MGYLLEIVFLDLDPDSDTDPTPKFFRSLLTN